MKTYKHLYKLRKIHKNIGKSQGHNTAFETDAGFDTVSTGDDILDFTERNPFGEIDEGF